MSKIFDDYARGLDGVTLPDDAKERLEARLAQACGVTASDLLSGEKPLRPRRRFGARRPPVRRRAVAAMLAVFAAAVALTGGVAYASGSLGGALAAVQAVFTGGNNASELGGVATAINESLTAGGYTVTLDGVYGDARSFSAVLSVKRADGSELAGSAADGTVGFDAPRVEVDGERLGDGDGPFVSSVTSGVYDLDESDNTIQYVIRVATTGDVVGKTVRMTLGDFRDGFFAGVPAGSWTFEFVADYQDAGVTVDVGQTITSGVAAVTVTGVTVSPVGVRVGYRAASVNEDGGVSVFTLDVRVWLKDGSEAEPSATIPGTGSFGATAFSEGAGYVSFSFEQLIDVSQVDYVDVSGLRVPIEP